VGGEEALHGGAGAGALLADHERLPDEPGDRDRRLGEQRMARRGDHHERIVLEALGDEVGVLGRLAGDREVGVARLEHGQHAVAVGDVERDRDSRIAAAERDRDGRQEGVGGGDHGEPQHAPIEAADLLDRRLEIGRGLDDPPGVVGELPAGRGQHDPPPDPLDQRQAEALLELANRHRHRRLGEVQLLPGTGDRAVPCHRIEDPDPSKIGGHARILGSRPYVSGNEF